MGIVVCCFGYALCGSATSYLEVIRTMITKQSHNRGVVGAAGGEGTADFPTHIRKMGINGPGGCGVKS